MESLVVPQPRYSIQVARVRAPRVVKGEPVVARASRSPAEPKRAGERLGRNWRGTAAGRRKAGTDQPVPAETIRFHGAVEHERARAFRKGAEPFRRCAGLGSQRDSR